ncbi:MAG: glycosyltransferase [Acidobacteriota bacterium]
MTHPQSICLMMIVRDEAHVIRRCLESVRPFIDAWAIVDTGSSDGTPEVIRDCLRDLPGEVVERPWRDFAHNRNQALELARGRGDYLLTIDADEELVVEPGFELPRLDAGAYAIEVRLQDYRYPRRQLVRSDLPWRYVGVLHEYLDCGAPFDEVLLPGIATVAHPEGARSRDPLKYRRDALMLEKALLDEPDNSRYVFYLAQSYRDSGDDALAVHHYERREGMGGWHDEVWFSRYQRALAKQRLGHPWPEVQQLLLDAFAEKPDRAEPLYRIAAHYQRAQQWPLAHLFLARAFQIPRPRGNHLFVEEGVYRFQIPADFGAASYYAGDHALAIDLANRLLRDPELPPGLVDLVLRNRRHSVEARHPLPADADASAEEAEPLTVVYTADAPGPALDDAVESLMNQDDPFRAVIFLGPGFGESEDTFPDDDRFTLIPWDNSVPDPGGGDGWPRVQGWLADRGGDPLIFVPGHGRLADPGVVGRLRRHFADPQCSLVYGLFRDAAGRPAGVFPAKDAVAFLGAHLDLPPGCPFAFRASLWREPAELDPGPSSSRRALLVRLLRTAGFERTRFAEQPLTVEPPSDPAEPSPSASTPQPAGPLISCLMVTHDRIRLARRAIDSFAAQTWPERELVIVTDGPNYARRALARHVESLGLGNVRIVVPEAGLTLGALRNRSMDAARGELLCQWDDDDWSHPDRLARQAQRLLDAGADACFLTEHLQFFEDSRQIAWLDWRGAARGSPLHPGTGLMRRLDGLRYPESGPHSRRGEDSTLLDLLMERHSVVTLDGAGELFLYTFHGRNTFDRGHHEGLTPLLAARAVCEAHGEAIRNTVAGLHLPKPVTVLARDGTAFVSMD